MKNISQEHPFFVLMENAGDWIILNILFVLTSLPVVTIGASLTAFYRVALRRQRGESSYAAREYLSAWKKEWRQSTALWIPILLAGCLLLFDLCYVENLGKAYAAAIGIVIVIWAILFSYAFPLQARFQNSIKNTLKNALALAVAHLPDTLLILLINSIPFACVAAGTFAVMMALPIYAFAGFALTVRINSIFFAKIFTELIEKSEEGAKNVH